MNKERAQMYSRRVKASPCRGKAGRSCRKPRCKMARGTKRRFCRKRKNSNRSYFSHK